MEGAGCQVTPAPNGAPDYGIGCTLNVSVSACLSDFVSVCLCVCVSV